MASGIILESTNDSIVNIKNVGTTTGTTEVTVPNSNMTMAGIVESGTNANGTFIKYEDGTLICHHTKTQTVNMTTLFQGMYFLDAITFTHPSTFISEPSVNIYMSSAGNLQLQSGNTTDVITASVYPVALSAVSGRVVKARYIAIGRWK